MADAKLANGRESSGQSYPFRRVRSPDGRYSYEAFPKGLATAMSVDKDRMMLSKEIDFDWIHPQDRGSFIDQLEFSAETLTPLDNTFRVVGLDNRVRWGRGISLPWLRPDGCVVWEGRGSFLSLPDCDVCENSVSRPFRPAEDESDRYAFYRNAGEPDLLNLSLRLDGISALVQESSRDLSPGLTARQIEIVRLIVKGCSNKVIARRLDITPGTVKIHVTRILQRLGATSRREIMVHPLVSAF